MTDRATLDVLDRPPAPEPTASKKLSKIPWWANPRFGLAVLLVGLVVLFSSLRPSFLDTHLTLVPLQADISVYAVVGWPS